MNRVIFIVLILLRTGCCLAQDRPAMDDDALYAEARKNAFARQFAEAQEILTRLLERSPAHNDARLLLGRTFLWQLDYENARKNFVIVLQRDASNIEGLIALSDTEFAAGGYTAAREALMNAVRLSPLNEDVLFKIAATNHALKDDEKALQTLSQLLVINPSHDLGSRLMAEIRSSRYKYAAGFFYGVDIFDRTYQPAQFGSVQLSRINAWGNAVARVNYSNRFAESAWQPEIDLYPRISKNVYAFLNYAYSTSALFPTHKTGVELFAKLPENFEASAGARYLFFDGISKVALLTGSVGYYGKNSWYSLRPYVALTARRSSFTLIANARRYLTDADSYIGVFAGFGYSPDMARIQSTTGLTDIEIYLLRSQRGGVVFQKLLGTFIFNLSAELSQQELLFDRDNYVTIMSGSIGLRKKF
ncbi:MAG TPA: YaiO family outer membrane beta-barrel protein [Chryseosolibacter sp.]